MNDAFLNTNITTSRNDMINFLAAKNPELLKKVQEGTYRLVDKVYFSIKALGNATSKELFIDDDKLKDGIINLSARKITSGHAFMIGGVQLQAAVIEGEDEITDAVMTDADFSGALNPTILNGELEIKVGDKAILPYSSCSMFDAAANDKRGFHKLENGFFINPDTAIVPTLKVGKAVGGGRAVVKFAMWGTELLPC